MVDASGLKPGLYIASGGAVKAVTNWDTLFSGTPAKSDIEQLAESVSWVFTALLKRDTYMHQIPYQWTLRGQPVKEVAFEPDFYDRTITTIDLAVRIDLAMQLYGRAFLNRLRGAGARGQFLGFQWLDPATIRPNPQSVRNQRYAQYFRMEDGHERPISADDLLIISRPGLRELDSAPSAGQATRLAAGILYGADVTMESLYRNNLVPPVLISVPYTTQPDDKAEIRKRWERILNPRQWFSAEHRAIPVNQGPNGEQPSITTLSLAPDSAQMSVETEARIRAIGEAHGVPFPILYGSSGGAATATWRDTAVQEFIGTLAGRFNQIAEAINLSPEVDALGYVLEVQENAHPAMRPDNSSQAQVFAQLVAAGADPMAAAILAGLDLSALEAKGVELVTFTPEPAPVTVTPITTQADEEAAQLKRWIKARLNDGREIDLSRFKSAALSDRDKRLILLEVTHLEDGDADDAPFPGESDPARDLLEQPYP